MSNDYIIINNISKKNINDIGKDYPYLTVLPVTTDKMHNWSHKKNYYFINSDEMWFFLGDIINMPQDTIKQCVNILYDIMKTQGKNNIMWCGDIHSIWSSEHFKNILYSPNHVLDFPVEFVFSKQPYEALQYYEEFELKGRNAHKKSNLQD